MRVLQARDVIRATPRTRIIHLDLGREPFPFTAGQAVLVALHGRPVRKPYSIACSPRQAAAQNALELLVQVDDADPENPHLERLARGESVDVEGPLGSFGLAPRSDAVDVLFVAGGTGIAPLRAMLWDVVEHEPLTPVSLIYSVRSADEIAYEQELRGLAAGGRLDLRVTVTREGTPGWMGPRGRIDRALIHSVVRSRDTRCVLCGPPAMIADVTALLGAAGIRDELIVRETFAA